MRRRGRLAIAGGLHRAVPANDGPTPTVGSTGADQRDDGGRDQGCIGCGYRADATRWSPGPSTTTVAPIFTRL
jgi:hypothetical protein